MYVICYDITETKVRNKIFNELKNYGKHTQYSVFECDISKKQLRILIKKLTALLKDEEEGNVRIYSLCKKCYSQRKVLGSVEEEEDDSIVIL